MDIDIIAASFIRSAEHVVAIKKLLSECGTPGVVVLAKIENSEGVQNFDSILQVADGIMIARGDLGVEVPLSRVPKLQKQMIRKCYVAGKPSVTATQMLESMIQNPRPTRAEVSDVANAIYDSTSCVMLSGETAVGRYPVEVVKVMKSIILQAEKDFHYQEFFRRHADLIYHDVPSAITLSTVKTAYSSNAKAIFAFTSSGSTARLLSRLRPRMPIVALTPLMKCYHQLAFNWGVYPIFCDSCKTIEEAFEAASVLALQQGFVRYGDLVVVTAGSPFGISGTTNMMIVENIGDVLVRGHEGTGSCVHGKVAMIYAPDEREPWELKDRILVMAQCDESYLGLIQHAAGVVLQNHIDDTDSEKFLLSLAGDISKPCIVRADGAFRTLSEGQLVTLDPGNALVYKGVVIDDQQSLHA